MKEIRKILLVLSAAFFFMIANLGEVMQHGVSDGLFEWEWYMGYWSDFFVIPTWYCVLKISHKLEEYIWHIPYAHIGGELLQLIPNKWMPFEAAHTFDVFDIVTFAVAYLICQRADVIITGLLSVESD